MDTTLKFERFILTKELNEKIKKVGDVFEIANVMDDSFLLRDGRTRTAIGVVSFEDFKKHFIRENDFSGWTDWTFITGFDGQNDVMYRTNRKKVQVKFLIDKVRAESCCSKEDDFNLAFGIQVAYLRCLNKAWLRKKTELEKWVIAFNNNIADNKLTLKNMINSLNK